VCFAEQLWGSIQLEHNKDELVAGDKFRQILWSREKLARMEIGV